jgi:hypothetical protein
VRSGDAAKSSTSKTSNSKTATSVKPRTKNRHRRRLKHLGFPAEVIMADTAYDADRLRQAITAKGALADIPNDPSRALKYPLDKRRFAQRQGG